ncbi:MAG: hypothetical protein ACR2GT_06080 [Gaiellaceae bacterium]
MSENATLLSALCARAVRERSAELVDQAFADAARQVAGAEELGDVRDGLINMPLPFDAAAGIGVDADEAVARAVALVGGRDAELLEEFARRPDRADPGSMGWVVEDEPFAYRWRL